MNYNVNPIMKMDYPDPDVIRVGDTYYMASTTMHFFPGGAVLRSYDLVNWEPVSYVYERLDGTKGQYLEENHNIYGQGMWAPCLRYHNGIFYICFVANDTHKTYLFTANQVEGPWERLEIEGFYHDCSLLFDEDDKVYIVYGNTEIHLTQLKSDLSGPMPGGIDRIIISDRGNPVLGYEGAHIYKMNGKYYVFLIHSRRDMWMRTQACFVADSLEGEFTGKDVLEDTRDYCNQGVAQGGIVDTPWGDWYAVLFQDSGAVGRIPILVPIRFEDDFPVFGDAGRIPEKFVIRSTRPGYRYQALYTSDDFANDDMQKGSHVLQKVWQFNHMPTDSLWEIRNRQFIIRTGKLCHNVEQAQNTLTQRLLFPGCRIEVTLNIRDIKEGDYAGLCALQGLYGMIAIIRRDGQNYLVVGEKTEENGEEICREYQIMPWKEKSIRLFLEADFNNMKDEVQFGYMEQGRSIPAGPVHKLFFKLDHFCGCRAGLFAFSTKQTGGTAAFSEFKYKEIE